MMKYGLLYILLSFLYPMHIGAQDTKSHSREKMESLVNPPLLKGGEALLHFVSVKENIGILSEDDAPRIVHFSFRNVSDSTVTVTRVSTTCGCTAARFSKSTILPGQEGSISLTYNPKNHPGTIDANAFVYSSLSEKSPIARLSLLGNVVPEKDEWSRFPFAMGALRLKRIQLDFPELASSAKPSERILCGNSGKTPLKLSAVILPPYMEFRTEPEIIQPGEEADIVVTIDGSKVPVCVGGQLKYSLLLDGVDVRPADRQLKITLKLIK